MKKTAKKTKTTSITKANHLRMVGWYSVGRNKRLSYIRVDTRDSDYGITVELSNPVHLRRIAAGLLAAADLMEDGK